MRAWIAVAVGVWLGVGCTVPSAEQLAVERLCAGRGTQTLDGVLRADKACDRGMELTVQSTGFKPGCVRVTVGTSDGSRSASTLVSGRPSTAAAGNTLRVGVQLSEAWEGNLRLGAEAFEQTCDAVAVTKQSLDAAPAAKGRVRHVRLELAATDSDDDGYVAKSSGGSDCNDANAAIHPGATERCDGVDDNCVDGEKDAVDGRAWYQDLDMDGYGSSAIQVCTQPAGAVSEGGDCDDTNASIRPGQGELRCDGKDDNCNGFTDEDFNTGSNCIAEFQCSGTRVCDASPSQASCQRTQEPMEWFVDEDGDGRAGTEAGLGCTPPVTGAVSTNTDCDESSVFVATGLAEVCDRLDNNCSGGVDEGCGPLQRDVYTGVQGTTGFNSIATYELGQKAWVVGTNKLVHLFDTTASSREYSDSSCQRDWKAAWAAQDGRVFIVGANGWLSTRLPNLDAPCFTPQATGAPAFTGVTGIDDPNVGATVYAVANTGKMFRWSPPYNASSDLLEIADAPANLRAVDGHRTADTLLAVGASDASGSPAAFRFSPAEGAWIQEDLGEAANGSGFLRGVDVVDARQAYAVGEKGLVLRRDRRGWSMLPRVTNTVGAFVTLTDVVAYSRSAVYVSSSEGNIHFFNGTTWQVVYEGTKALMSMDGPLPTLISTAGDNNTVLRFHP
ncbi:hypothetical protein D7Y13_15770 [Corallococcus praedator]|uniref:Lipoprotein n=1 Tax=Corallococcus praedator TaxID=2316724 RepID=A0ABX9QIS3_9BACT|nr:MULTISPECIES: putative metal-binding motif-containing protein [Corallococcus]RKH32300.1 hypothetical protein D7X75_16275 [Corallococcus sp. CA031C]RKI08550.1 hypothetical protein D7Y13_15770 [Corallococcus praedator]